MDRTIYWARITCPVLYSSGTGPDRKVPIGPCLIESTVAGSMDIVWGARGQSAVTLPVEQVEAAQHNGYIVLLDCQSENDSGQDEER